MTNIEDLPIISKRMNRMEFEGVLYPHTWFYKILKSNNSVDMTSITILANFLFIYNYKCEKGEKFEYLNISIDGFRAKFGFGKKEFISSINRLNELNLLSWNYATSEVPKLKKPTHINVFLNEKNIKEISYEF